jgi:hypothetical protein
MLYTQHNTRTSTIDEPCTTLHVARADPNHPCLHYEFMMTKGNESAGSACPINGQTTRALSSVESLNLASEKNERDWNTLATDDICTVHNK